MYSSTSSITRKVADVAGRLSTYKKDAAISTEAMHDAIKKRIQKKRL